MKLLERLITPGQSVLAPPRIRGSRTEDPGRRGYALPQREKIMKFVTMSLALTTLMVGCQEPKDYRNEVVGNGEGGVEIHRVPKDPSETTPADSTSAANRSALEQRVEVLEATVLRQQQEIADLHRQLNSRTAPATAP